MTAPESEAWTIALSAGGQQTGLQQAGPYRNCRFVHVGFSSQNLSSSIHHLERLTLLSILAVMFAATAAVAVISARLMPHKALTQAAELVGTHGGAAFQSLP